jgi:hypothetical protein
LKPFNLDNLLPLDEELQVKEEENKGDLGLDGLDDFDGMT